MKRPQEVQYVGRVKERQVVRTVRTGAVLVTLCREGASGIAFVEMAGSRGREHHYAHPYIGLNVLTYSRRTLQRNGFWEPGQRVRILRAKSGIYCYFNIDRLPARGEYPKLAAEACQCGGRHPAARFTLKAPRLKRVLAAPETGESE